MKKEPAKRKASKKTTVAKAKTKSKSKEPISKKTRVKSVKKDESDKLADYVVKGIQEKKGENIVQLNLKKIDSSVCNYFVICEANSRTQVDAIAQSVEELVKKSTGQKPYHAEGYENAEWILIDYVDVVVHIFQRDVRAFYRLEDLWADAEIKHFN